jgi:hypothetical protein
MASEFAGHPNLGSMAHHIGTGIVHANSGRLHRHPRLARASTRWLANVSSAGCNRSGMRSLVTSPAQSSVMRTQSIGGDTRLRDSGILRGCFHRESRGGRPMHNDGAVTGSGNSIRNQALLE